MAIVTAGFFIAAIPFALALPAALLAVRAMVAVTPIVTLVVAAIAVAAIRLRLRGGTERHCASQCQGQTANASQAAQTARDCAHDGILSGEPAAAGTSGKLPPCRSNAAQCGSVYRAGLGAEAVCLL